MKTIQRTALLALIFMICAAPTISFDAMAPARVDIPSHIQSIALFDRSHSTSNVVNFLEKGLIAAIEGEPAPLPRICLTGIYDQLNQGSMVTAVKTNLSGKRPGSGLDFPPPMDWQEVNDLCRQFNTDALIVLEIFHMQLLSDRAEVKTGLRLYDPGTQTIIDEVQYFHDAGWRKPTTLEGVIVRLANKDEAMHEASYSAGRIYANRITPSWYRVERKYYKRSRRNPDMAEGARMMEVNNWDAAIEALTRAYDTGRRKTKGRAAHNLAVIHEILGQNEKALEWAQTAWGKHRNRKSRDYAEILRQRINEVALIKAQESN